MKLSFSTVGCPNWTWPEITSCAGDLGFRGVELRGIGDDLSLRSVAIFQPGQIGETAKALRKTGLSIACVASNILLCVPDLDRNEIEHTFALARGLSCSNIRVLGDEWGPAGTNVDETVVLKHLRELAPEAEREGVVLLVESNGVWAQSGKLKSLIEEVGSPAVQVLWDIHHPYRYFGEQPEQTYENLAPYIRHVHVKDSVMDGDTLVYKMLTYGDLPLNTMISLLKKDGYDGYLSMEWVKRWNEHLEEPGVAFAHYKYSMDKIINSLNA